MSIKFTQFLRPNGERKEVSISIDEKFDNLGQMIIDAGYWFEIEELRTGEISMTISDEEQDLIQRVCVNGPAVIDAVKSMIREAKRILKMEPL